MNRQYEVLDIVNYIIDYARDKQKIRASNINVCLFLISAEYIRNHHTRLFHDSILKNTYGPYIERVSSHLRMCGFSEITELIEFFEPDLEKRNDRYPWVNVKSRLIVLKEEEAFREIADRVLEDILKLPVFDVIDRLVADSAIQHYMDSILKGMTLAYSDRELLATDYHLLLKDIL